MELIDILFIPILCILAFVFVTISDKKKEWQQKKLTSSARSKMANHNFLEKGQYRDGWALVKLEKDRFAFVNNDGQFLNNEIFTAADAFMEGTAIVYVREKGSALIDKCGHYVIPFNAKSSHTRIKSIWKGIYLYTIKRYNNEYNDVNVNYIIRNDGSYIYSEPILSIKEIKDNYIKFKSIDGIGEIDFTGRIISRPYKYKVNIGGGYYMVQKDSSEYWGVDANYSDKIIIPCEFSSILYIEKYSRFILYPKSGFPYIVDSNNKIIVPQIYKNINLIDHQYIQVNNNKRGIIDENGKVLVQAIYSRICPSTHGFMAFDENKCDIVRNDGCPNLEYTLEKIISTSNSLYSILGRSYFKTGFEEFFSPKPNYLIVTSNGLFGVIDLDGNLILPIQFNSIQYCEGLDTSRFIVEKDGLWGLADPNGRITIPIRYKKMSKRWQNEKLFFEVKDSSGNMCFLDTDGVLYNPNSQENREKFLLFFDTETTGVPKNYNAPSSDIDNWPRLVQLSWILTSENNNTISRGDFIIKPEGFIIPLESTRIHGITNDKATNEGADIKLVIELFLDAVSKAKCLIGHNISFDMKVVGAELHRLNKTDVLGSMKSICTMKESINFCAIPSSHGYKYPKLQELYYKLFGSNFSDAHNSSADTQATVECFFELVKRNVISDPEIRINTESPRDNKTHNDGWKVKNVRYFSLYELDDIIKAEVVRGVEGNSCCVHLKNKNLWQKPSLYYTPMTTDSTLDVGEIVDLSRAEIVTLQKAGENNIERIRIMKTSSNENSNSGQFVVKNVRKFTSEEEELIHMACVVTGENGRKTCCFIMKNGDIHYIPMSDDSTLDIGTIIDLSKAEIVTLHKEGKEDIERIRAQKVQ